MKEIISKAILSGLGFASLTRDAIRATARDLVKQSKLSEAEGRRLVQDFQGRAEQAQKVLEKKVHAAVHKALRHLDVAPPARRTKAKGKSKANTRRRRSHSVRPAKA